VRFKDGWVPGFVILACSVGRAGDVRLTNDSTQYVSAYTLGTGLAYTDSVLQECSKSRGRQNEPAVAVDPRDIRVLIGSSNDYCGVYAGSPDTGPFVPSGPTWLGYYRSENGAISFTSSLVPGYPGDTSEYAALSRARTSGAGDPVVTWDAHGRVFLGSESSGDPALSKKTLGDVWVATYENPDGESGDSLNDGKRYVGTSIVARGSSAPNLLGVFNDKTAIQADRTRGVCDGIVYFAWARFTGVGVSNIYIARSTDHGGTWSKPVLLTQSTQNVQDPDISVTGNGHVFVTFDIGAVVNGQPNGIGVVKSTDCGMTFSSPALVSTYIPYTALDSSNPQPVPAPKASPDDPESAERSAPGALAHDCGDFADACLSGYTFFRRSTITQSAADQFDASHEYVYIVYDASKPGTEVNTGTSYGSIRPGVGSQSGAYFIKYDGTTGMTLAGPTLIDDHPVGHQVFPDISADGGILHVIWWDSRNDSSYSPARPIGNDSAGHTSASLDVFAAKSTNGGTTWISEQQVNTARSNPNYEQYDNRMVPFGGDYLTVTSLGTFAFGTWTDWRDTVAGPDPREPLSTDGADVKQCRTFDSATGAFSGDQCPHLGGLDSNIYGATIL